MEDFRVSMDRRGFIALCRKRRAGEPDRKHARLPVIDPAWVLDNMAPHGEAVYLYSIGGGDEQTTFTRWRIPLTSGGSMCLTMPLGRTRLWELRDKPVDV